MNCWLKFQKHLWIPWKYRQESFAYGMPGWSYYTGRQCAHCGRKKS